MLVLGERTGLHDLDYISDLRFVVLIVSLELGGIFHLSSVERMTVRCCDLHNDRLVHLVGHDGTA